MELTPHNECNASEIEMIASKAMCAWANLQQELDLLIECADSHKEFVHDLAIMMYTSEYESTVRILCLFVEESFPEVQETIIKQAKKELGIQEGTECTQ